MHRVSEPSDLPRAGALGRSALSPEIRGLWGPVLGFSPSKLLTGFLRHLVGLTRDERLQSCLEPFAGSLGCFSAIPCGFAQAFRG